MALHKFGYTEETLQTRLIEDIQDSYEKLEISSSNVETKLNNNTNEIKNISLQLESIKNEQSKINSRFATKLINLEEKYSQPNIDSNKIKKEIIQLLYNKGLFDSFPNKDQVFEPYLIFTDNYISKKYGNEIKIGEDIYYLSDLNYETSRENIILGLIKQEKLDMVDIKYRMKLTESEISRIIDERSSIKGVSLPLTSRNKS